MCLFVTDCLLMLLFFVFFGGASCGLSVFGCVCLRLFVFVSVCSLLFVVVCCWL